MGATSTKNPETKKTINLYSKEEAKTIYKMFHGKEPASRTEKEEYAKSIGRTFLQIQQKANYEKSMKTRSRKRRGRKMQIKEPATVQVTHVTKPIASTLNAVVSFVDGTKVEVPSRKLSVNGIMLEW